MPAKRGRPAGNAADGDNKEKIIRAVVALIKKDGAGTLTVRQVCKTADVSIGTFYHYFQNKDDLLMYFVREESFAKIELWTPLTDFAGRITELYMYLVRIWRYRPICAVKTTLFCRGRLWLVASRKQNLPANRPYCGWT